MGRMIALNKIKKEILYPSKEEAELLTSIEKVRDMINNSSRQYSYPYSLPSNRYGLYNTSLHLDIGVITVESIIKGEWEVFPDTPAGWILYGDICGRMDD